MGVFGERGVDERYEASIGGHEDNTTGGDTMDSRNFASTAQMYSPVASLVSMYECAAKGPLR